MSGWDSRKTALLIEFYYGAREMERSREEMDYGSHYANGTEFIVWL